MNSETPYGSVSFAPFDVIPEGQEWARDPSGPAHGDDAPSVMHDGTRYDEFALWMNSWMEDDSRWDDEVRLVHTLLRDAAPLDDDSRIMRLQITSYEACHYGFPDSIMHCLASIGDGTADKTLATGCYAQYAPKVDDARRKRIEAYASVLEEWTKDDEVSVCTSKHRDYAEDTRRIHEMLGEHTHIKRLYARRLAILIRLLSQEAGGGIYGKYSDDHCYPEAADIDREILLAEGIPPDELPDRLNAETFKALLSQANPLLGKISSYYAVNCRHNLFHHFDVWISSVGCGSWRGAMPETGENRKQIEKAVADLVPYDI